MKPDRVGPMLPGRLGLGPGVNRSYEIGPWVARWEETIAWSVDCANLANETHYSKRIHQPFRVRGVQILQSTGNSTGLQWIITLDIGPLGASSLPHRTQHGLFDLRREGTTTKDFLNAQQGPYIQPGTIITQVPTRLQLTISNNSGAAQEITALVDVTYLAKKNCPYTKTRPPAEEPEPV